METPIKGVHIANHVINEKYGIVDSLTPEFNGKVMRKTRKKALKDGTMVTTMSIGSVES